MTGDDRTLMEWIRGEWWWRVSRHWRRDAIERRVAWWIPRNVALWCFIRVYAAGVDSPGPEYRDIYDAWEKGAGK